jgi:hypothetical protein
MFISSITSAQAAKCRDVVFSVTNTIGSVIRITKVRYRDFEDNRQRTTNFANRTLGRAGEVGHRVGIEIDLKDVRNERVGEFEFQYQRQTAPPNVVGVSSWGNRRWSDRQGNISSCNANSSASIRIPN